MRVFLTSGERRVVAEADGAHIDDGFFLLTRRRDNQQRLETLLTLWAGHVIEAQIEKDGVVIERVPGRGRVQES